jgi:hypothetical protein
MVLRGIPPQLQRLLVATKLHRILAIEGYVPDPTADLAADQIPPGISAPALGVSTG